MRNCTSQIEMKVVGLFFVALSLVSVAQASYRLSCAKSELGIRWPSYESNSEYYVCPRLFAKQAVVSCNPGEIFTFALQSCSSPSRYIPAPPLENLPTASPLLSRPNNEGYLTPLEFDGDRHPPILNQLNPAVPETQIPVHQMSAHQMPGFMTIPQAPLVMVEEPKHVDTPVVKEEQPIAPVETANKPMAPLPPTPPPTPPMVEKKPAGKKPESDKKKKSSAKPSKNAKKPAAAKNQKKPSKNSKSPAKKTPKA